ncbi:putative long-chain-fatty-acid--CoA ligase [Helianthus debilis subsp. tardiflorus]
MLACPSRIWPDRNLWWIICLDAKRNGYAGYSGPTDPNLDARLVCVPEMNYDALSSKPQGEVCIRGDVLFSGYQKREDLTKEVLADGWFHTGDIGEWQPDGSMKIIDRKKNIFKLSQGEYVAVEYLEIVYGLVPDIDAVWIYGNSFESCLVGVVNPYKQAIEHYAETHNISGDFDSLCVNPMIKEYILGELMMCTTHPHPHPHPHPKPTSEKTHVQDSCACIVSFYLFPFLKVLV